MKKIYTIKDDYLGTRLDRWFKKNISEVPQSLIEKNLRRGKIKVNHKKVKSLYKLQKNDQVTLYDIVFSTQKKNKSKNFYKATKKDLYEISTSKFGIFYFKTHLPAHLLLDLNLYFRQD